MQKRNNTCRTKIAKNTKCYVKTLHLLSTCNTENYIKKGTLKKLDNNL